MHNVMTGARLGLAAVTARRPGELLIHLGIGLFVLGVLLVFLTVAPVFFGAGLRPLWLALTLLAALVGLTLTLTGLARGTRAVRRRIFFADHPGGYDDLVAQAFARR